MAAEVRVSAPATGGSAPSAAAPAAPLVRVSCVRHVYPDRTLVHLCGLDFVVGAHERVVILGPNGCGKTTLLYHILGLLEPAEGEVSVLGVHPARDFAKIRERVGVLLQNSEEQIIAPTVWDDVSFSPRSYGYPDAEVDRLVNEALERVGIPHLKHKALVLNPELLVLDEPFEGLDPTSRTDLIHLLNDLHHRRGVSMVMATHDVNAVAPMADRVYVLLRGGEIVAEGLPADIFRDPGLLKRSNIEPPVLSELFQRLEQLGVPLGWPQSVDEAARVIAERIARGAPRGGDPPRAGETPAAPPAPGRSGT
jgi:cobalt/nickel transport system ATP-binding protein